MVNALRSGNNIEYRKAWENLFDWNKEKAQEGKHHLILKPANVKQSVRARLRGVKEPWYNKMKD
jgi:hypothetical protein